MDREWFQIEGPGGRAAPGGIHGRQYPNKESAAAAAAEAAQETDEPLLIVKITRRELKRFKRVISIEETDVSSIAAPPVP
jgi:hypothetical protein